MAKGKTLDLTIQIAGKVDKSLVAAIDQTGSLLGDVSKTVSRVGSAGLAAMGLMATGTVAALAQCTDAAKQFESSMADVVKYVDGLADTSGKISNATAQNGKTFVQNYGEMKAAILDLSTQIPYTADELTQLAAAAGQSGKTMADMLPTSMGGNGENFLRDVAMWGAAMDVDAAQAGDWAAKWEVALDASHKEVMEYADIINYLGANTATTAAEIASAVNSSASLGQVGGVNVPTTIALADAMLATGVASDRVGTSIKRMVTNLSKGESATKAQKELWLELGFTADGVAKSMQEDATKTLTDVFNAIKNMPKERQVAALSTLLGQWAIEGGAKVVNNMDAFTKALDMVSDPSQYLGSMEREFIIKSSTSENIDKILENAKFATKVNLGDAFLPAKKEMALALVDFLNSLRNMPELGQAAETITGLFASGVTKAGDALEKALPYIQQGLDYIVNNGPKVVSILGKLAAVFTVMKFAPGISSAMGALGGLVLGHAGTGGRKRTGGLLGLWQGGKAAGSAVASTVSTLIGATHSNGFFRTMGAAISSLIAGNGIKGTRAMLASAAASPGILSGFQGIGSALASRVAGSGLGQYLGGIGTALGNTKLGTAVTGLRPGLAGIGATASIYGSIIQQNLSGVTGKAEGLVSNIANSGIGQALGGFMGSAGGVLRSGARVTSSIFGPLASGFGSLVAGAAPVIGAISTIIAVVSLLGDHLDDIRNIVGNVFGEQSLAVFDRFIGTLGTVKDFVVGLFQDGGVATALAPVRGAITEMFGDDAGVAFDGLVSILQSVMGVAGQVVTFATTYVKPIIQDIFSYISGTVVPGIMQTFTTATPFISSIITSLGSAVMTVMTFIGQAIQSAMPFVKGIIGAILTIGSTVIPTLLAGVATFAEQLVPILEGIRMTFGGIVEFVSGIFTANWTQAWTGVKNIFVGIFSTLGALFKVPINAVIALINKAISGINGLGITIPDWVPAIGGREFRPNIPKIPMLARGGFTTGPSIAGEAGREAVISFDSAVRAKNIATWMEAGRLLGVNSLGAIEANAPVELRDINGDGDGWDDRGGITFAPQIIIQGNADKGVVEEALREAQARFEIWYEQMMRKRSRVRY